MIYCSEKRSPVTINIPFVQSWTNGEDVGPTLYKCYTNIPIPSKHNKLIQCLDDVGLLSTTSAQHQSSIGSMSRAGFPCCSLHGYTFFMERKTLQATISTNILIVIIYMLTFIIHVVITERYKVACFKNYSNCSCFIS